MTDRPLRIAGWGRTAERAQVTWSIAEGRRGRRWREVVAFDEGLWHALLLETGPDRRFAHLELAAPGLLASLHPEPDGTVHGNAVDSADRRVRHVVGLPTAPEGLVVVDGSIVALAAVAWQLTGELEPGRGRAFTVVRLDLAGDVTVDTDVPIERATATAWMIGESTIDVGEDGQPMLAGGSTVPLELDPGGVA
jgi:hypothetical protein